MFRISFALATALIIAAPAADSYTARRMGDDHRGRAGGDPAGKFGASPWVWDPTAG